MLGHIHSELTSLYGIVIPEVSEKMEIADLVFELARRVRRITTERLDMPGLTPGRLRALKLLDQHGPIRMGELAELLGVAPRSVTDVIDDLHRADLVNRLPDPDDRRAILVGATDKGRRLLRKAEQTRAEVVEELFGSLSSTQLRELKTLLSRVLPSNTIPGAG